MSLIWALVGPYYVDVPPIPFHRRFVDPREALPMKSPQSCLEEAPSSLVSLLGASWKGLLSGLRSEAPRVSPLHCLTN